MQYHETPETIEELKAWYRAHHLPPESVTRFFIGRDVREPKAFGIYQDGDRFVVYKNKANGIRVERYHGPDERYAVHELYQRLKQEIAHQKACNQAAMQSEDDARRGEIIWRLLLLAVAILVVLTVRHSLREPQEGYYRYEDTWYYCQSGDWYAYEDEAWYPADVSTELEEHAEDYFLEDSEAFDGTDFALTQYYSTTDTDSDWSSEDTWCSDDTDWDSDW